MQSPLFCQLDPFAPSNPKPLSCLHAGSYQDRVGPSLITLTNSKGTVATRFGDKDSLLHLIAVAHANGLEIYPDVVLNQVMGGQEEPAAPDDRYKRFRYRGFSGEQTGRWPKDHWNFHPNPDHWCRTGDWCQQLFGPDVCYLDAEPSGDLGRLQSKVPPHGAEISAGR
jgi:hypothetical protein